MQLYFSANLCFTPFTVHMPKKSITFECTNRNIYLYVCVMWGELNGEKVQREERRSGGPTKRCRVSKLKVKTIKEPSEHESFLTAGAVPFQSQELASCTNRFRKTDAGAADGTFPKTTFSLFFVVFLSTLKTSHVCVQSKMLIYVKRLCCQTS